ncbi:MAG: phage tail tape measure protein, partial [Deltaproteobacteria bacterium CG07_land_8_20_14_0_80_38_7]
MFEDSIHLRILTGEFNSAPIAKATESFDFLKRSINKTIGAVEQLKRSITSIPTVPTGISAGVSVPEKVGNKGTGKIGMTGILDFSGIEQRGEIIKRINTQAIKDSEVIGGTLVESYKQADDSVNVFSRSLEKVGGQLEISNDYQVKNIDDIAKRKTKAFEQELAREAEKTQTIRSNTKEAIRNRKQELNAQTMYYNKGLAKYKKVEKEKTVLARRTQQASIARVGGVGGGIEDTNIAFARAAVSTKAIGGKLLDMQTTAKGVIANMKMADGTMVKFNATTGKTISAWKELNHGFLNSKQEFGDIIKKFGTWTIAAGVVYGVIGSIRDMLEVIKKVDYAMIGLAKVYRGNLEELLPLKQELIDVASTYGATVEATINVATKWARLGYKQKEIIDLTRVSLLAQNVAELESGEATELLTAALVSFRLNASSAVTILDNWNTLSNQFSVTTKDLAQSVSKAGATFRAGGADMAYLNAITMTIVQSTKESGNVVGNSLKTFASYVYRLQTMKKVYDITTEATKRNTDMNLDLTVAIKRQGGELLPLPEIIGKLAKAWAFLTPLEREQILQTTAGIRQRNRMQQALENYGDVLNGYITQLKDEGSAIRENALFMGSLQKKLEQLRASYEALMVNTGDAGLLKDMKNMVSMLDTMIVGLGNVNMGYVKVAAGIGALTIVVVQATKTIRTLTLAIREMGFAAAVLTKGNLIGLTVSLLAAGFSAYAYFAGKAEKATRDLAETSRMARKEFENLAKIHKAEAESAEYLCIKYVGLKKELEKHAEGTKKYNGIKKDLIETSNKLVILMGIEKTATKNTVEAYDVKKEAIDRYIKKLIKQSEQEEKNFQKEKRRQKALAEVAVEIAKGEVGYIKRAIAVKKPEEKSQWTLMREREKLAKAEKNLEEKKKLLKAITDVEKKKTVETVKEEIPPKAEKSKNILQERAEKSKNILQERIGLQERFNSLVEKNKYTTDKINVSEEYANEEAIKRKQRLLRLSDKEAKADILKFSIKTYLSKGDKKSLTLAEKKIELLELILNKEEHIFEATKKSRDEEAKRRAVLQSENAERTIIIGLMKAEIGAKDELEETERKIAYYKSEEYKNILKELSAGVETEEALKLKITGEKAILSLQERRNELSDKMYASAQKKYDETINEIELERSRLGINDDAIASYEKLSALGEIRRGIEEEISKIFADGIVTEEELVQQSRLHSKELGIKGKEAEELFNIEKKIADLDKLKGKDRTEVSALADIEFQSQSNLEKLTRNQEYWQKQVNEAKSKGYKITNANLELEKTTTDIFIEQLRIKNEVLPILEKEHQFALLEITSKTASEAIQRKILLIRQGKVKVENREITLIQLQNDLIKEQIRLQTDLAKRIDSGIVGGLNSGFDVLRDYVKITKELSDAPWLTTEEKAEEMRDFWNSIKAQALSTIDSIASEIRKVQLEKLVSKIDIGEKLSESEGIKQAFGIEGTQFNAQFATVWKTEGATFLAGLSSALTTGAGQIATATVTSNIPAGFYPQQAGFYQNTPVGVPGRTGQQITPPNPADLAGATYTTVGATAAASGNPWLTIASFAWPIISGLLGSKKKEKPEPEKVEVINFPDFKAVYGRERESILQPNIMVEVNVDSEMDIMKVRKVTRLIKSEL